MRRHKVVVIYKSGARVQLKTDKFELTKEGGRLVSVDWGNARPRPMLFGIDEIAAIYEV